MQRMIRIGTTCFQNSAQRIPIIRLRSVQAEVHQARSSVIWEPYRGDQLVEPTMMAIAMALMPGASIPHSIQILWMD